MASLSFLRPSTRPDLYVCAKCALRATNAPNRSRRKWISTSWIQKTEVAVAEWEKKAKQIRAGKEKSMLTILEERGLVHQIAGTREGLDQRMTEQRLGVYVGIDPTASSIHVGHLLPFMALFWMYVHGYRSVILLGGATAKIGDPTDRLTTREKEHRSTRAANMANMHYQLKQLWGNVQVYGQRYGYYKGRDFQHQKALLNNNAWWNKLPLLEVLQTLGHGMRVGPMLARDTVKNKLTKGDGMSFAEFTYPLMQAWDWWHLYDSNKVQIQIGGADQYGNITAGVDAVKHIAKTIGDPATQTRIKPLGEPFGFTVPLLTTSSGAKFGKSAGNAVWLSKEEMSVFDQYGYFLRTSDDDVKKYLKLFTFMTIEDIDKLVEEHMLNPSKRKAQHKLASELMELVHGAAEAHKAAKQHQMMFSKHPNAEGEYDVAEPPPDPYLSPEIEIVDPSRYNTLNTRPKANIQLPESLIKSMSIGRILFASGLAASAAEGHRIATQQAVFIGGMEDRKNTKQMLDGSVHWTRVKTWSVDKTQEYLVGGDLLMLRRGKHAIRIIQVVPDEEFDASGKSYPGMKVKGGPLSDLDKRGLKIQHQLKTPKGTWEEDIEKEQQLARAQFSDPEFSDDK
ncbi:Mitochondrial tyrosine--tRNA ligase [Lachnellula suecica]|uniref:Tyrosine--tRNA ligase n=1 Tax=Lachnellula suecica TaxID=602035 RepID=A0A8T9C4M0_9HELO|nr:Mitochondrial tyrosine--tRNA ligase [Lachnellula suecica]